MASGFSRQHNGTANNNHGTANNNRGTANIYNDTANINHNTVNNNRGTANVYQGPANVNYSLGSMQNSNNNTYNTYGSSIPMTQDEKEKHDFIESLKLTGGNPRSQKIDFAYKGTLSWIWDDAHFKHGYRDWLGYATRSPFYYIQGKPAAGKSTLMKYISDQSSSDKSIATVSYFFYEGGTPYEKTFRGCFSSLLRQLLDIFPDLALIVYPIFEAARRQAGSVKFMWEEELLKRTFTEVIQKGEFNKPINMFIDALDECESPEARRSGLEFLKNWVEEATEKSLTVRLCLSSRPQVATDGLLSATRGFTLQDYSKQDIRTYVEGKLGTSSIMECREIGGFGPIEPTLIKSIVDKSDGVFLWAVLTTKEIVLLVEGCKEDKTLQKHIDDQSGTIRDLYASIFKRIFTGTNTQPRHTWDYLAMFCSSYETYEELNTRMCSEFTLSDISFVPESFEDIMKKCHDPDPRLDISCIKKTQKDLHAACGNLLEVIYPKTSGSHQGVYPKLSQIVEAPVQLVHRSLREFILQDGTFSSFYKQAKDSNWIRARTTQLRCYLGSLILNPNWDIPWESEDQKLIELVERRITSFFAVARFIDHNTEQWKSPRVNKYVQEYMRCAKTLDDYFSSYDPWWYGKYHYSVINLNELCELEPPLDMLSLFALEGLVHYISENIPMPSMESDKPPLLLFMLACPPDTLQTTQGYQSWLDLIAKLIRAGHSVNQTYQGLSCWQYLVIRGFLVQLRYRAHLDIYRLFMEYGADPNCCFGPEHNFKGPLVDRRGVQSSCRESPLTQESHSYLFDGLYQCWILSTNWDFGGITTPLRITQARIRELAGNISPSQRILKGTLEDLETLLRNFSAAGTYTT